jgi:hypothetical protein
MDDDLDGFAIGWRLSLEEPEVKVNRNRGLSDGVSGVYRTVIPLLNKVGHRIDRLVAAE